jgi:hypothetical protein
MPRAPDKQDGPHTSTGHRQPTPSTESRLTDRTGSGKDRWHQLADAIAASNMRASDKSVFRFLLDKADYTTAELPPKYTPPQVDIGRKTSIRPRQVTYAIDHLRRHGWLSVTGTTGPGKSRNYTLLTGTSCDCTGRVHVPPKQGPTLATNPAQHPQPETGTLATFEYRTLATNASNAAGQNGRETRGTEREAVEAPSLETTETACPRHQTTWGPHRHCLYCQALNIHLWP